MILSSIFASTNFSVILIVISIYRFFRVMTAFNSSPFLFSWGEINVIAFGCTANLKHDYNLRTSLNEPKYYYAFRKHQKANNFELLFDEFVTQAAL